MMKEENRTTVSIFTPTFNRENHIAKLFESLCKQDILPLEWIVIDDGDDGTDKKIQNWMISAPFPIIYVRKKGERGINRAFNEMVKLANGKLIMKVDDDDYLTCDAVKKIISVEKSIQGKNGFAGVAGLRGYRDGTVIGTPWKYKKNYIDATNFERPKYSLKGDKAEAYYLSVLKEHLPFPEFEGEYYTWEGLLWDRIAHSGYKLRWFKKVIYITEYLPDGASAGVDKAYINDFKTYTLLISEKISYKEIGLLRRIHMLTRYYEIYRIKEGAVSGYFKGHYIMSKASQILSFFTVKYRSRRM